jgi:probable HAF family extracellular repeat protein
VAVNSNESNTMTPRCKTFLRCVSICAALCFSSPGQARTALTFDGPLEGESADAFHARGPGSLASVPGPKTGVVRPASMMRLDSGAGGSGDVRGEASPSAALLVAGIMTMNVSSGFQRGFSFFYTNPFGSTEVRIFEGPNLTGRILSTTLFAATVLDPRASGQFLPAGVRFTGVARSVGIVSRGPGSLYIDNLTFGSDTPGRGEPNRYSLLDLGRVTDGSSRASGPRLNRAGQLFVQTRLRESPERRVVFWDPVSQAGVELGTFGGDTVGTGLNGAGQIVGWSFHADTTAHAFIWHADSGLRDLGTLGGPHSMAFGVNDTGEVVGAASPAGGPYAFHAFLWRDGVMTDLNDLPISNREGWQHLERADSVSDNGVIVGSGFVSVDGRRLRRYFALVPIPN